jgi:hypothetical protein
MFRRVISALSLMVLASSASAGSSSGIVAGIYANDDDTIIFFAGSHEGKPACSTVGDSLALSLATPAGRAMYAMLLSAQAQGKSVSVGGTGTCSATPDRESPRYIAVFP